MPILGFFVATAFWPGLLDAATAPRWAVIAAGVPLVSRLDPGSVRRWPLALFGLWLAYAALSLLWAPDRLTAAHELFRLLILAAVFLAAANLDDIGPVLRLFGWGVAASSFLAVPQFLGWSPVGEAVAPAGLFYNRDFLAELVAPLLVWAVWRRDWWLAVALSPAPLLCQSRVALIAIAAGLGWHVWQSARWRWLVPAVAACVLLVAALTLGKTDSTLERLAIWQAALSDPRIFGHGMGAFTAAFPVWEYAHSDALQAVYELGIGAGLPALLVLVLCRNARRAIGAASIAMAVEIAIAFPLHLPASGFLAVLLAGGLARARPPLFLV
jgi:hypothetical protein